MVLLALPATVVRAERPDEPGALFAYESADVLTYYDVPGGDLRVHYSVEGPNQAPLFDDDFSGVPDYVEAVASMALEALSFFEAQGFRAPLREAELDLPELGGSHALDIYLVDFGGAADGYFSVDDCLELRCAGHVVMENDFEGYRYESEAEAIGILTSHELFHGVQYAYTWDQGSWVSEGTAVWAEEAIGWGHGDFIAFSDTYLEDAWRPLDRPPSGPVPAFSYGTALFWDFLTRRHGPSIIPELQLALIDEPDGVAALGALLDGRADTWEALWLDFAQANLATGSRAGALDVYPYAGELDGPLPEVTAPTLDTELRLWGLGARYLKLEHPGGALSLKMSGDIEGVHVILYPTEGGAVLPPLAWLEGGGGLNEVGEELGDQPGGSYWILATLPYPSESSQTVHVFAGAEKEGQGGDDAAGEGTPPEEDDLDQPDGCGCNQREGSGGAMALLLLGLWARPLRNRPH